MKKKSWIGWMPKACDVETIVKQLKCMANEMVVLFVWPKRGTERDWAKEWWPPKKIKITVEEV